MTFIKTAIAFCVVQIMASSSAFGIPQNIGVLLHEESNNPSALEVAYHAAIHFGSSLKGVQNNTQNIANDIGQSVTNALTDIQHALADATNRWNHTVQDIVVIVHAIDTAEDDCILSGTPLDNVTLGFKADLVDCFEGIINTTITLGEKADDIQWKTNKLMRDTKHTMDICGQSNVASNVLCLTENLPPLISRTFSLLAEILTTQIQLVNLDNIITLKTDECVAVAFVTRIRQAGSITEDSLKCFTGHFKH